MKHRLAFWLILVLTWPVRWLPYRVIHALGNRLGSGVYYLIPKFRKRALSNLALASDLHLTETQIRYYAKASLQNLMITCLEYAKFASEDEIQKVATCVNPEEASRLMQEGKPVIFFCGHLANWEVLFLEGTSRMPGVAIGRPIKNIFLYDWVTRIREKFGGTMLAPQNAIKEGLRGLKRGSFLGIVGDQGMPDSGYCSPFLGRSAWTSPIAALLAHKTGSPIVVATTLRKEGRYFIHYSEPIWPKVDVSREEEVDRLMRAALSVLEEAIAKAPGQWLWSHNRWKQQTPGKLKAAFRHEAILIVLPQEEEKLELIVPHLGVFREIYPHEFITLYVPAALASKIDLKDAEVVSYAGREELLKRDLRFKLVFNFTPWKEVGRHFKGLSAFTVVSPSDLHRLGGEETAFPELLRAALLK